ncbi:MAG: hypothetical protein DRZ76_02430 [Candidatus Nealsonbacteria bacterium]|nr:MAG: hypothetical protein DRZ76_02430 [Candidatus Nealsonbacteria bacterium]
MKKSDIYLVCMPFGSYEWPSIGIGQLITSAKKSGLDASAFYANVIFAKKIGYVMYSTISSVIPDSLVGEWVFSRLAFPDFAVQDDNYFNHLNENDKSIVPYLKQIYGEDKGFEMLKQGLLQVRDAAEHFVNEIAEMIIRKHPKIVGSSALYSQYTASLSLLRRVKELNPNIVTMIGGPNCEEGMAPVTIRNCSYIDYVVSGEADSFFGHLCMDIMTKDKQLCSNNLLHGVYNKSKAQCLNKLPETAVENDLDSIPFPNYDDYFAEIKKVGLDKKIEPILLMETSRGCWKGNKKPCTFCGLNGGRRKYRMKSLNHSLEEMDQLAKRYEAKNFLTTDTILHLDYFKGLFPELKKREAPYNFFFETISMLNENQVKLMANAGVNWIQPGIESLNDELLVLLNKGNKAINNVALLVYALENNIKVSWNMLWGIPGDKSELYEQMANFLPLLYHLDAPLFVKISFQKFSYYHENQNLFNLHLTPDIRYHYLYPYSVNDLDQFAFFFDDDLERPLIEGAAKLYDRVKEWEKLYQNKIDNNVATELCVVYREKNKIIIKDTRPCAVKNELVLSGLDNIVFQACRAPVTQSQICNCVETHINKKSETEIINSIGHLIELKIILSIGNKYIALANNKQKLIKHKCFIDVLQANKAHRS